MRVNWATANTHNGMARIALAVALVLLTGSLIATAAEPEGPTLVPSFPSIGSRFDAAPSSERTDSPADEDQATAPESAGAAAAAAPTDAVPDGSGATDNQPPESGVSDSGTSERDVSDSDASKPDPSESRATEPIDRDASNKTGANGDGDQQPAEESTAEKSTAKESTAEESSAEESAAEEQAPAEPRRQLTPEMAKLRDRVRRTLGTHHGHLLSTDQNTVTEILYACRAFGCDTLVNEPISLGKRLNGITCLCWNYPCSGFAPLLLADEHITGRIGYGCQESPGQLLATLAIARVQDSYPVRVGDDTRTVADLVAYEKLACREGTDKSLSMIGLMYYTDRDAEWTNRLGQKWSIERILREELDKPIIDAPWGGTQRLMGLSYVVDRRAKRDEPIDGQYARTQRYIEKFHDYALKLQNGDGTWNGRYFAARGVSRDPADQLAATARIVEWLAFSLPEDRLDDPHLIRGIAWLDAMLSRGKYGYNAKSLSTAEIASVMHGLHALRVYDHRYFKPADPPPEAEPKVARKSAS